MRLEKLKKSKVLFTGIGMIILSLMFSECAGDRQFLGLKSLFINPVLLVQFSAYHLNQPLDRDIVFEYP